MTSLGGKTQTVNRQEARRAVVAGKARWLHDRPKAVEVRQPARPPVRHARTPFGAGILRSLPTYRLPVSLDDLTWWAAEAAREEGREIDRMYDAHRGQSRLDSGLQPW